MLLFALWGSVHTDPKVEIGRLGRRQFSSTKLASFRSVGSVHTDSAVERLAPRAPTSFITKIMDCRSLGSVLTDAKVEVGRPGVVISPPWTRTGSRRIQNYTDQPDLLPTQPTQRWVYGLNNPYQNTPPPPPRCLTNSKLAKHGSELPGGGGWARTKAFAK